MEVSQNETKHELPMRASLGHQDPGGVGMGRGSTVLLVKLGSESFLGL